MTHTAFFTIGYEGATPENFTATLQRAGIAVLLDVRDVAWSRKPGFSKEALRASLAAAGIDYLHLKGLGNPRPKPGESRSFDTYLAHLGSAASQADLAQAIAIAKARPACLLCFEKDPLTCHRNLVAPLIAAASGLSRIDLFVEKDPARFSLLPG